MEDPIEAIRTNTNPGDLIGSHFRVLRLLGRGGMGEVYLAERTDDVQKQVALKVMRTDLPISVARARRERQILARLNHPNIAGLVDAGVDDRGQPWFAMEYVEGERITDWCDHEALDVPGRVRLFAVVCRALQFAHRNLVLHRDLKPSNIMVDRERSPKLLDFGIAKLLDVTDAEQTQTLALTPAYAAPEQMRGEPATTATDVFQLGLVFYELIVGVPARTAKRVRKSQSVSEASLPRIDEAFVTLAARDAALATRIAQQRGVGVDRLRRSLKGDLDRIVAKATAAEPRERYETAQAMADDLDRWLMGCRWSRSAGRSRIAFESSFCATQSRPLRSRCSAWGSQQAVFFAFNAQRQVANQQRERAEQQRRRAETLLGFMNDVFRQADPQNVGQREPSRAEMLNKAAAALDARNDLDPLARSALKTQIADTFNALFLPEQALESAHQALDALEADREHFPADYLASAVVALDALQMLNRSDEQLALVAHALPLAKKQADGPEGTPHWLGRLLKFRGAAHCSKSDYSACSKDLLASIEDDPQAPETLNQLAVLLSDEGDAVGSVTLLRRAEDILERSPIALKVDLAIMRQNIATGLYSMGQYRQSLALFESLESTLPGLSGADAGLVLSILRRGIARCKSTMGDHAAARLLIERVIADLPQDEAGGVRHAAQTWLTAAKIALDADASEKALSYIDAAEKAATREPQGMEFMRLRVDAMRGEALLRSGRCTEAVRTLGQARSQLGALLKESPSWVAGEIDDSLGRCALERGDSAAARASFAVAVAQFRAATGPTSPSTLRSEIHQLWSDAAFSSNPEAIAAIRGKRTALAEALGSDSFRPLQQVDELLRQLEARTTGAAGPSERVGGRPTTKPLRVRRPYEFQLSAEVVPRGRSAIRDGPSSIPNASSISFARGTLARRAALSCQGFPHTNAIVGSSSPEFGRDPANTTRVRARSQVFARNWNVGAARMASPTFRLFGSFGK